MIQQRYGFFRVDIAELRVTIQASCLQTLVRIKSSLQTTIKTYLQNKAELSQKMIHEKELQSLEWLYIDMAEQTDQEKMYRARHVFNKKTKDCRKKTHVEKVLFRKRANGKLQKLTL